MNLLFLLRRGLIFLVTLRCLATAVAAPGEAPPVHTVVLPLVAASPAVLLVANEVELRAAIYEANVAFQLPRIELTADIPLTAPLSPFENVANGAIVMDGNGHTLDGRGHGPILSVGPGTTVIVDELMLTGGRAGCGGAIFSAGHLTLRDSYLNFNVADGGGGICAISSGVPASLTLERTTVAGNVAELGGGIFIDAPGPGDCSATSMSVVIHDSLIEQNRAERSGGGIFAHAGDCERVSLDLVDSSLLSNGAVGGSGGAVYAATREGFVFTTLRRSTVAFNSAARAGGLYNEGSTGSCWYCGGLAELRLINSTLSSNVGDDNGGAIFNVDAEPATLGRRPQDPPPIGAARVTLWYTTVTNNRAAQGSGIWNAGELNLNTSIIAANAAAGGDCRVVGQNWSHGYNLDSDDSCGLDQPTDLPNSAAGLLPLALNAPGRTMTHALGPASAARDRIPAGSLGCNPAANDSDQRGIPRPQPAGGLCDMGAYEFQEP